jgi:NADH-quinone oxidoreductase subunit E
MSWDKKLLAQANKIIKQYPQKRSALGPLLHLAQSRDGYISDDSIEVISRLVGITEVQVKSVSTFYSMYKQEPTGKYLVSVCKSISCK